MTRDIDVIDAAIEGYWGTGTMDQLGDHARDIARASMRRALEAACAVSAVSLGDAGRDVEIDADPVAYFMSNDAIGARTPPVFGVPNPSLIELMSRSGFELQFLATLKPTPAAHDDRLRRALNNVATSLSSRRRELRGPLKSTATRYQLPGELRSQCAASGFHDHDGCSCTDEALLARSKGNDPSVAESPRSPTVEEALGHD